MFFVTLVLLPGSKKPAVQAVVNNQADAVAHDPGLTLSIPLGTGQFSKRRANEYLLDRIAQGLEQTWLRHDDRKQWWFNLTNLTKDVRSFAAFPWIRGEFPVELDVETKRREPDGREESFIRFVITKGEIEKQSMVAPATAFGENTPVHAPLRRPAPVLTEQQRQLVEQLAADQLETPGWVEGNNLRLLDLDAQAVAATLPAGLVMVNGNPPPAESYKLTLRGWLATRFAGQIADAVQRVLEYMQRALLADRRKASFPWSEIKESAGVKQDEYRIYCNAIDAGGMWLTSHSIGKTSDAHTLLISRPPPDELLDMMSWRTVEDVMSHREDLRRRLASKHTSAQHDSSTQVVQGNRSAYSLEPKPLGRGGFCDVFRATHKPTKKTVAFKKLRYPTSEDDLARMRREIEVCRALADNENVIDILDHDPGGTWYVMPLADGDLWNLRETLTDDDVPRLFEQVATGLAAAHELGYIHRDLKPHNILRVESRWVVSDWGLVRRPRGQTTAEGRTVAGRFYGTEGFAAPEAAVDSHALKASADVYSLGQILGWIPTGAVPLQNIPPRESGRWSTPALRATALEESARPRLSEFVEMVRRAGAPPPASSQVEDMVRRVKSDEVALIDVAKALDLARRVPNERMLFDVLPRLDQSALHEAIVADRDAGYEVVRTYGSGDLEWGRRSFEYANTVVMQVVTFAEAAAQIGDMPLLQAAADAVFYLDADWDRWRARNRIRRWLRSLSGEAAALVANRLRILPADQRDELASGATGSNTDPVILEALNSP